MYILYKESNTKCLHLRSRYIPQVFRNQTVLKSLEDMLVLEGGELSLKLSP